MLLSSKFALLNAINSLFSISNRSILSNMTLTSKKICLSGIKPTGDVHIGNYLGMIAPALELQENYDCIYFIADLHALTTIKDAQLMHEYSMELVATFLALGLDTDQHIFFRQSDVPMVTEFTWYLTCFTGMGLLEKAHAYKDAKAKNREINHGIFAYPVLMAADILMYDVEIVPVGKDQKQHVEFARDIAGSVNAHFDCEVLKLPQPSIKQEVMVIPGLDGQKMSKSYNNVIPLWAKESDLRKKILSLKTDSTALEQPKQIDGTTLGLYYKLFASPDQYSDLSTRLAAGGLGWGHAKQELFEQVNSKLAPARKEYYKLREDEPKLRSVLASGAERAKNKATERLSSLRKRLGFD